MNFKTILSVVIALSFVGASFGKTFKINLLNPNNTAVLNAPVVIKLANLSDLKTEQRAQLAVFIKGKQVSSQLDDLDKDGIADELVFLADFEAEETKTIELKTVSDKKRVKFPKEVYADLILKDKDGNQQFVTEASSDKNDMYNRLYHHGIAFESVMVAYRIYFDNKSTIDVYGKKKYRLEIAETGWYPTDRQLAADYGDDILLVSGWVGVGTVKGWDGKKALHIDKFDKRTQRIVTQGNIRTVSEIEVLGWQYEDKKIDLRVRYIMYARHRDVLCEVTASEDISALATGVQQIGGGNLLYNDHLVGSWGSYYPQNDTVKYAKETAGLGVYVPAEINSQNEESGVDNLIVMPYKKGETLQFYLTCISEKEYGCPIKTSDVFFSYLKAWRDVLKTIQIK
jgi:hypothetical protein